MGFKALASEMDKNTCKTEYQQGERFGNIVLGDTALFFKKGFGKYYIPYQDMSRFFKRVMVLNVKNKKTGENSLQIENCVIMDAQKEVAQIQLPGYGLFDQLAAKILEKNPEVQTVCPRKLQKKNDRNEDNINL